MARPVHGLLRPLLLPVCFLLLLQVSECSRPSPSPANHLDNDALHHQLLLLDDEARTAWPPTRTEVAGDGRTGAAAAAPSSAPATTPARAVGAVIASSRPRQTSDRALVRAGMLLRPKPARRFLAGADLDGASCHSYNPHINCPPAGKALATKPAAGCGLPIASAGSFG